VLIFILLVLIPYVAIAMAIGRIVGSADEVLEELQREGVVPIQHEEQPATPAETGWDVQVVHGTPAY
jgi:hypothetical protein